MYLAHYDLKIERLDGGDAPPTPIEDRVWDVINSDEKYRALRAGLGQAWHAYDEAMRSLSMQFPHVLLTLSSKGELSSDLWRKYYLAGKCQKAKITITFEEFNPGKLQEITWLV